MIAEECRTKPTQTALRAFVIAVNKFRSDISREPASALSAAPPGESRWDQNGSIVYLAANGATRRFYYEVPKEGLVAAGAKKGALLFDGRKTANNYSGSAYEFAKFCKPTKYLVTGDISNDDKRVTLKGRAPEIGSNCKITGYKEEVLVFDVLPVHQN